MKSYSICFPQHNTLQVHPYCYKQHNSFFCMVKIYCIVCIYTPHLYSSIYCWTQKFLPYLGYCKLSCNEHRSAYIFSNQCFHFLQIDNRGRIAGSYGSSIFNFLRKLHTVFYNSSTHLHYHQKSTVVLFSPYLCQHLLFVVVIYNSHFDR